jgi:sugar lactone lactonase YvrE
MTREAEQMGRQKKAAVVSACMMFVMAGLVWGQGPCTAGIETVAGYVPLGDGSLATTIRLYSPIGVAVDPIGNVYIAEAGSHRIRRVSLAGTISTVAGIGVAGSGGDGGQAIRAMLNTPTGVAVDTGGNLYVADQYGNRLRRVTPFGVIQTIAGTGAQGSTGDNGLAVNATLLWPRGVAVDSAGNVYVSEYGGARVRKVSPTGLITTVAGTGSQAFGGDGGLATEASLRWPAGLAVDNSGNLYIADRDNHRVRKVDVSGIITTVAGNGTSGNAGDGGAATSAQLCLPEGVAVDALGNLYIANACGNLRKVDQSGTITTVANVNATGVAVDAAGNIYLGYGNLNTEDVGQWVVKRISVGSGTPTVVAGMESQVFGGDDGPALLAQMWRPSGVAVDLASSLYIADTWNNRIRKVTSAGIISTVAGTGTYGYGGDEGGATAAKLASPTGIAVDADWDYLHRRGQRDTWLQRRRWLCHGGAAQLPERHCRGRGGQSVHCGLLESPDPQSLALRNDYNHCRNRRWRQQR